MNNIKSLAVYLGSSGLCRDVFKETARKTGQIIGESNRELVYGGMDAGLMGIVASSSLEYGAHVTGIIPKSLKDSERVHPNLNETILVPDLWERKRLMFQRADVVIVLPGGFGTIDEALEALYWANLSLHKKPIVFVNIEGYWDHLIEFLKTLPDMPYNYYIEVSNTEQIIPKLESWKAPSIIIKSEINYPHFEDDILRQDNKDLIIDNANIKNTYILATALGLKQLGKHNRPIGLLNDKGQFDLFLKWVRTAQNEHFITPKCTRLFSVAGSMETLEEVLNTQKETKIDLHEEKWGPSETETHIEIVEKN
ncbi:MAG: TIGR00730 family Rossman fold protein [Alphaproteobacteria bacterium]|nr:TIGR00730 family Rossman fold protein [Alphaproteobacteria bacterium]